MVQIIKAVAGIDAGKIASALSAACNDVYGSGTRLNTHVTAVFGGFAVPDLRKGAEGLLNALSLFPQTLTSANEMTSFVSTVVWESVCLSQTKEAKPDPSLGQWYGRGYIQLTGQANYNAFAKAINRNDILTNPGKIN